MARKGGMTAVFKERAGSRPFEKFSWALWGYLRLNQDRNPLDSKRWTEQIQLRLENELCFVVDPLKLEIDRLKVELEKAKASRDKAMAKAKALRTIIGNAGLEVPTA